MRKQRFLYLAEGTVASIFMLTVPYMMPTERLGNITWDISALFVAWICGMAAIGFAKQYLNWNNHFRKLANEAIYPFYLLHQPVIVVIASFITKWDVSVAGKAIIILVSSFILTVAIYWFMIRPFNGLRIHFGLKAKRNPVKETFYSGKEALPLPINKD